MKKYAQIASMAILVFASALPVYAQTGGCTDSPENPTAVLGLLVSAVSIGYLQIRNRIGNRRKTENK